MGSDCECFAFTFGELSCHCVLAFLLGDGSQCHLPEVSVSNRVDFESPVGCWKPTSEKGALEKPAIDRVY